MKKSIAFLVALVMMLSLCACAKEEPSSNVTISELQTNLLNSYKKGAIFQKEVSDNGVHFKYSGEYAFGEFTIEGDADKEEHIRSVTTVFSDNDLDFDYFFSLNSDKLVNDSMSGSTILGDLQIATFMGLYITGFASKASDGAVTEVIFDTVLAARKSPQELDGWRYNITTTFGEVDAIKIVAEYIGK